MPRSPHEIERKHFIMALRGYDKEQVDAFLKELAAEQQALLDSVDAATNDREAGGPRSGPDPFEGLAAQLESILKHAAEQADLLRSAAADDVARQLEAARGEVARAGRIRAAAEQDAAQARHELENARSVRARAESDAAATMESAHREVHDLHSEITVAAQRVDELREAAVEQHARAAEVRASAEREAAEVRASAEREAAEVRASAEREAAEREAALREAAERDAADLRAAAERDAADLRGAAERDAADLREAAQRDAAGLRDAAQRHAAKLREAAEQEAAELRGAAEWACQESAKVLEAAEEERRKALELLAKRDQQLGGAPLAQPSNRTEPSVAPDADRGGSSQPTTTGSWLPFADD